MASEEDHTNKCSHYIQVDDGGSTGGFATIVCLIRGRGKWNRHFPSCNDIEHRKYTLFFAQIFCLHPLVTVGESCGKISSSSANLLS